jgi:hypothetical protein
MMSTKANEEWIEEVEKRIREIKVGSIQLIPGDQVFKEVEDRYKR